MQALYAPFNRNHDKVIVMDVRSSELTKYAANAMLATKISFMNEIANLAEQIGADIEKVRIGIGADPRIGYHFIYPGTGYGGSCFPKDSLALLATAQSHSVSLRVVESSIAANDARKRGIGRRVITALGNQVRGKTIAILGLTFKANTDDMREAPSLNIIAALQKMGARVRAYDPEGMEQARHYLQNVDYAENAYDCVAGADGIVVATEWKEFQGLDFARLGSLVSHPVIVDLRNILDSRKVEAAGFELHRIGSPRRTETASIQVTPRLLKPKNAGRVEREHPAANGSVRPAPQPAAV